MIAVEIANANGEWLAAGLQSRRVHKAAVAFAEQHAKRIRAVLRNDDIESAIFIKVTDGERRCTTKCEWRAGRARRTGLIRGERICAALKVRRTVSIQSAQDDVERASDLIGYEQV